MRVLPRLRHGLIPYTLSITAVKKLHSCGDARFPIRSFIFSILYRKFTLKSDSPQRGDVPTVSLLGLVQERSTDISQLLGGKNNNENNDLSHGITSVQS